jgi:FKBP-type peptidyl-prolyl cis-trans isomerase FklB
MVNDRLFNNMKSTFIAWVALSGLAVAGHGADAKTDLKDQKDKVSYGIGVNMGKNWKRQAIEVNVDMVAKGLRDGMADGEPLMSETEIREVLNAYQADLKTRQEAKQKIAGQKNKEEGTAFLAENAKKEGVKTTPSGLQYKILKEGTGPKPTTNDTVVTHYRGTLIDGKEFDSSQKRGMPATFRVTGVIRGWTEALQMMSVGSKLQVFIPSDLAYGERGYGADIAPNATLIFDLELLEIKPPVEPNQPVTSDIIKVPSAEELKKGAKIEVLKPDGTPKNPQ